MNQPRAAHREHFLVEQPAAFALVEAAIAKQHRHIDVGRSIAWLRSLVTRLTSTCGLAAWKRCRRGISQNAAKAKSVATCSTSCWLRPLIGQRHRPSPASPGAPARTTAAGLGQLDAAVDAVEQARAQLLFQALDLLADRRLGGAQLHAAAVKLRRRAAASNTRKVSRDRSARCSNISCAYPSHCPAWALPLLSTAACWIASGTHNP
jgi:hypothetical protein